jgi:N-acetylglucosamine kinase-like BadF-type ATPase
VIYGTMSILIFDQGQTQTRVRLVHDDGSVSGDGALPARPRGSSLDEALLTIAAESSALFGVGNLMAIVGGATGLFGQATDLGRVANLLRSTFGTTRLVVADDCLTGYIGALGEPGAVVIAVGTGVVALGMGHRGALARVDGYGAMLGDEGSGWWIGRQGLISAFSHVDGRPGGSEALWHAANERYGPLVDLPAIVARDPSPVSAVAGFAFDVAKTARAGDSISRDIWSRAGRHLARCAIAAANRAELGPEFQCCITGRIGLAADLFTADFARELAAAGRTGMIVPSVGSPLDGAHRLAFTDRSISSFGPLVSEHVFP